ncbi:alpha/beta fold hydrolase [Streptomyces lydicus]
MAPDLPGSGGTRDPGRPLTLHDLVAHVVAAARDAGLDRFHVVGHSLGAVAATATAALHPDLVNSLTAHAGWARSDPQLVFQFALWQHLARTDPAAMARMMLLTAMGKEALRAWDRTTFAQVAAALTELLDGARDGLARQSAAGARTSTSPACSRTSPGVADHEGRRTPRPTRMNLGVYMTSGRLSAEAERAEPTVRNKGGPPFRFPE